MNDLDKYMICSAIMDLGIYLVALVVPLALVIGTTILAIKIVSFILGG